MAQTLGLALQELNSGNYQKSAELFTMSAVDDLNGKNRVFDGLVKPVDMVYNIVKVLDSRNIHGYQVMLYPNQNTRQEVIDLAI